MPRFWAERDDIRVTWDEQQRWLELCVRPGAPLDARTATWLADMLETWVQPGTPVRALVDYRGLSSLPQEWVEAWMARLPAWRGQGYTITSVAFLVSGDKAEADVLAVRDRAGFPMEVFRDEAAARAWLERAPS